MEGSMDVLFEAEGKLWVGEYKTDHVDEATLVEKARQHERQVTIYQEAVRRSLGHDNVGCTLIFLRKGVMVEI